MTYNILFTTIWRGKWIILALALIGAAYGFWQLRNVVPTYVARIIVAPTGSGSPSPDASSQFSRALAPLELSFGASGGTAAFDRLVLAISSPILAKRLQEKHAYMQMVFGSQWAAERERWRRPGGPEFERRERIREIFNMARWSEPSLEKLARYIGSTITVSSVPDTGFREIAMRHADPDYALEVLKTVYEEADGLVRDQDFEASEQNQQYLTDRLSKETAIELTLPIRFTPTPTRARMGANRI